MKTLIALSISALLLSTSCESGSESTTTEPKEESTSTTVAEDTPTLVLVGTYTRKEGHVDGKADGIYLCHYNPATGQLDSVGVYQDIINPSYVTVHPNGQYAYAVSEVPEGEISAYTIDRKTPALQLLNKTSTTGAAPCHVSVHPDGAYAYAANYVGGNTVVLPLEADGRLGAVKLAVKNETTGPHARQEAPHAHMALPFRSGFISVDLGADKVSVLAPDATGTALEELGVAQTTAGAGPRHLAVKDDFAYVLNELNGTIEVFQINSDNDPKVEFSLAQQISTTADGQADAGCSAIRITPDGRFLYAANRAALNNIAMFSIQPDGQLTFTGTQSSKGLVPRDFNISPDGQFLLVANQNSDNIVTFKINSETGQLEETPYELKLPTPVCLVFLE